MGSSLRYLVYDIESVIDKDLLQKVLYPELEGDSEAAYQTHLKELAEDDREFVNPAFHRPVTIAALGLNDNFEILKINLLGKDSKTTQAIVTHFWDIYNSSQPALVDFNGKGFDLRLLELWAFRLGLTIRGPHFEKFGTRYRFNEDQHLDLHEFLTNYGAIRLRGGLNLFSKLLGKPGKMHTTGDKVQELYEQNKQFQIDDYCLCDVMDTYFVFLRTMVMRGVIDLNREKALVEAAKSEMENKRDQEGYFKEYLEHFRFWEAEEK
jgi:predicted PolB exonuclease-like 3'-5' exonuclease